MILSPDLIRNGIPRNSISGITNIIPEIRNGINRDQEWSAQDKMVYTGIRNGIHPKVKVIILAH